MANVATLNGFQVVGSLLGSPYTGRVVRCYKAAGTTVTHDMFVGDLVQLSGSGDASGVPGVSVATAGDTYVSCGVVVGIENDPAHPDRATWIDGADAGYVLVNMDPYVILEAEADEALSYTAIGNNANMVKTAAGSRTAGTSGQEVDATVATSSNATYQLKIIGFPQRADNEINATYNRVLVIINNHLFKGSTGTAAL